MKFPYQETPKSPADVAAARSEAPPKDGSGRRFLSEADIVSCETFRDAVRMAWEHRARRDMTQQTLAEACDLYAPHVSSYLHPEAIDKHGRRRLDLPADRITAYERAVGNYAITQYMSRLGMLTIMEEVIAQRVA